MTVLARSLSIASVVEEAGLSHQTFHNTFPGTSKNGRAGGKDVFVEELLENLSLDYTGFVDRAESADTGERGSSVGALTYSLFDALVSGQARRRVVGVLLAADHEGVREATAREFDRMDADFSDAVRSAVQAHGGSIRKPLNLEKLSTVLGALLDGLALRELQSPGSIQPADVATSTESILRWAIDPVHSDRGDISTPDIDPSAEFDPLRPDLESDILAATEKLFAERGYFLVTLADIATASRITVDDLKRLFPSKIDIIVAALAPEFERVLRLRRTDEKLGVEPLPALTRSLTSLAEFVDRNRAMSKGMLLALSFEQFQEPSTVTTIAENLHLPSAIAPIIERGQQQKVFAVETPAIEMAIMLTNNVLFRSLTRPNERPIQIVDAVLGVMLPGVEARAL